MTICINPNVSCCIGISRYITSSSINFELIACGSKASFDIGISIDNRLPLDYHRAVNFCITGFIYGESIGSVVVFADRKTFVNSHFASLTIDNKLATSCFHTASAVVNSEGFIASFVLKHKSAVACYSELAVYSVNTAVAVKVRMVFYSSIVAVVSRRMGNVLCLLFQIIYITLNSRQLTFCCGTIFVYRCSIVPSRIRKTCNFI